MRFGRVSTGCNWSNCIELRLSANRFGGCSPRISASVYKLSSIGTRLGVAVPPVRVWAVLSLADTVAHVLGRFIGHRSLT
jgi:hypothetical protein